MATSAAAAGDVAFSHAWDWWCDTTPTAATGGILGVVGRCYWPLGTTVTEIAADAVTRCPRFSAASPLDVVLSIAAHFQWWIGLCFAFLQWYGVGAPATAYYRLTVGLGSALNLLVNVLLSRYLTPSASPYWPTCGSEYSLPCFSSQAVAFYLVLLGAETTRRGGSTSYQLVVASVFAFMVPLARLALGYNTLVQVITGSLAGVAMALLVDMGTLLALLAWRSRRRIFLSARAIG